VFDPAKTRIQGIYVTRCLEAPLKKRYRALKFS
jgi:hypothetical protein